MKINELKLTHKPLNMPGNSYKILTSISKECSQFLDIARECGPIFHGFREKSRSDAPLVYDGIEMPDQFIAKPRENRRPLDTPQLVQDKIDDYLKQQGFSALRGNSIFCTSDANIARFYGGVYYIFPYNGFEYTYSRVQDLLEEVNALKTKFRDPEYTSEIFVADYAFRKNNLATAINNRYEIYLKGTYIALSHRKYHDLVCSYWGFSRD